MSHSAFGEGYAANAARFFGTPYSIAGQTIAVVIWVVLDAIGLSLNAARTG